jgi:hypothetical protein
VVHTWTPGANGIAQAQHQATYAGDVRLAARGGAWAVAGSESDGVTLAVVGGGGSIAAPGGVGAVAWGPNSWAWTTGDVTTLNDLSGAAVELAGAVEVRAYDLDGDGELDWMATNPEGMALLLLADGKVVSKQVPVRPDHLAIIDLNADGCADVVVVDAEGKGARILGTCGAPSAGTDGVNSDAGTTEAVGAAADGSAAEEAEGSEEAGSPLQSAEPPTTLDVDPAGMPLRLAVGQHLDVQITDPRGRARKFTAVQGLPRTMTIGKEGKVTFSPSAADVGSWTIKLKVKESAGGYLTTIDLEVLPASALE